MSSVMLRLVWILVVLVCLWFLATGLWDLVHFEPTGEAIAQAHRGRVLILGSCVVLTVCAALAIFVLDTSIWVAAAVLVPVVLCGGLALLRPDSLFPVISIVVAYPFALAGLVGVLLLRGGRGE